MTADVETEVRILDAAHAVFLRRGTGGARMQEIADEAGVNKALLHYYFRSKDRLAQAVFERAAQRLLPPILATLASDLPLEEKVRRTVEHELSVLSETPALPAYLIGEMHHHPERIEQLITRVAGASPGRIAPPLLATLQRQIEEGVRAGTMRPIRPEELVVNLVSLCVFPFAARPLLGAMLGTGDEGFRRLIAARRESLADFFLNALRP
jgi:TetR/AcrR family transcriptional regulator